jgi:hypothetical protein
MLDVDKQDHVGDRHEHLQKPSGNNPSLTQWVQQVIGLKQARIRSRVRGNNLHILCESQPCPDAETIVPRLADALTASMLERFFPSGSAQVYRVIIYGRATDCTTPNWTTSFYPTQSDQQEPKQRARQAKEQPSRSQPSPAQSGSSGTVAETSIVPMLHFAQQGKPDAIACYLSDALSTYGIAIKAKVKPLKQTEQRQQAADGVTSDPSSLKRLLIGCESAYSPDPVLLAEPIAHQLRQLELQGFQDAIILGQVSGELQPEWLLRVDLTPPSEILKDWARWGDVQAIVQLLNRTLESKSIRVSALLKDSTLHLSCSSTTSTPVDKRTATTAIASLVEALTPQGIHAVTIYGVTDQKTDDRGQKGASHHLASATSPLWVDWLNLPAASNPALTPSTLELAQQGNLEAITFLLTRLLNPDLETKLATGGIRVQIRRKADLLHIMTDAPNCPVQSQVGSAVIRFLKPLQITAIAGVRVYGRRAGQTQPLWSYGGDFASRDRLVPEATPEFAASDAYIDDLLSPPGALALRTEHPPADDWWLRWCYFLDEQVEQLQRVFIRSQLFVPQPSDVLNSGLTDGVLSTTAPIGDRNPRVALVWGTVGVLLVIQSDWILGQLTHQTLAPPAPLPTLSTLSSPSPQIASSSRLPNIALRKSNLPDQSVFNSSSFTQAGSGRLSLSPERSTAPEVIGSLPASPLQLKAPPTVPQAKDAYPTFNSRQMDEKIALYRHYIEQNGVPDVLLIGSSRTLRGVDPVALETILTDQGYTGIKVFNFGVNGATVQVVDLILRQIIPPDKLPKLILLADGSRALNSGRLDITYNGIIASEGYKALVAGRSPIGGASAVAVTPASPIPKPTEATSVTEASPATPASGYKAINQEMNQWLGKFSLAYSQRDRIKTILKEKLTDLVSGSRSTASENHPDTAPTSTTAAPSVLSDGQGIIDIDGFLPLPNRFHPTTYYQKYARVPGDYDSDYEAFDLNGVQMKALTALVEFTHSHQISLVFVNLPLTNEYLDLPRKRLEEKFQQHMLKVSPQLGLIYRDLGLALADHPEYFSDPSHLNRYGAYEVSRRLARDVMIPWKQARK